MVSLGESGYFASLNVKVGGVHEGAVRLEDLTTAFTAAF
jgi:hypothetical protein